MHKSGIIHSVASLSHKVRNVVGRLATGWNRQKDGLKQLYHCRVSHFLLTPHHSSNGFKCLVHSCVCPVCDSAPACMG